MFNVLSVPDYESYVSRLPNNVRPYLDKELDWDNKGLYKDLNEIARWMLHWEETLSTHLELTDPEIYDIVQQSPQIQR